MGESYTIGYMKIIFSTNTAKRVLEVESKKIKILEKKGFEVHIVCQKDDFYKKLESKHKNIHYLKILSNRISPFKDIILIQKYYSLYKKINPDIIFQSTIKPNIYGSLAVNRIKKIKIFNHVSGLGSSFNKIFLFNTIIKRLYKIAFSKSTKVFFQNTDDLNLFKGMKIVSEDQAIILPTGIELKSFKNFQKKSFSNGLLNFIYVGRLIKEKGIIEFIDAANIILKEHKNVNFYIFGDPHSIESKKIRYLITAMSKKYINNFFYEGYNDEIVHDLHKFDCIVVPSYREGLSNVLLEAGACRLPSIASNVPGCNTVIDHKFNGLLFEKGNVLDLTSKIEDIISMNVNDLKTMGYNAEIVIKQKYQFSFVKKFYLNIVL